MSSIPVDLYYDILLRLPTKSLLICKSLCKYWYALISNPSFANMHLNFIFQRDNFISLTPNYKEKIRCEYVVHSTGYETLFRESHQKSVDDMLFKGCSIFSSAAHTIELWCSCNGLVCLHFRAVNKQWICLWNPATR